MIDKRKRIMIKLFLDRDDYMENKELLILGGKCIINKHTGYVYKIEDWKSGNRSLGGIAVDAEIVKSIIKDGYIPNWQEIYTKWQNHEVNGNLKEVILNHGHDGEPSFVYKEKPKQEEKKSYEDGFYSWVPPKKETKEEEPKQEEPDIDILSFINQKGKERRNMRYEGAHTAGRTMDQDTAERARRNAQANSRPERKYAAERNREQTEEMPKSKKINWKKTVAVIMIMASMAAATLGVEKGIDTLVTNYHTSQEQTQIATLLVPEGSKKVPTIVERNTHDTSDFQGFWYDNAHIAEEIMEIPDVMFDATFYSVYNEMGEYRSTSYINNWDEVIANISSSFEFENEEELNAYIAAHPNAYARCADCKTFEEFLTKNGFVDDQGLPSPEKFVEYSKTVVNNQYDFIKTTAKNYGTDWVEEGQAQAASSAGADESNIEGDGEQGFGGR